MQKYPQVPNRWHCPLFMHGFGEQLSSKIFDRVYFFFNNYK